MRIVGERYAAQGVREIVVEAEEAAEAVLAGEAVGGVDAAGLAAEVGQLLENRYREASFGQLVCDGQARGTGSEYRHGAAGLGMGPAAGGSECQCCRHASRLGCRLDELSSCPAHVCLRPGGIQLAAMLITILALNVLFPSIFRP
ncbi:glucokinase [Nocardia seriolae]|uniref:Glucokinase n=1 Tax=Nocardia seriolae TaxID=37332 RepID=A0ABC9Z6Y6_9NOCA|nr:hypothetical protein NS14008_01665 [Nocardia seriolae]GAM51395.1 glucokinase [Nocardia seriolae]GAP33361.1 glucokinase [Nocardia seriolae]